MAELEPQSTGVPADPVTGRIGTVLCGKWTLERLLGQGAMAAVYVGRHKIGRRAAIKILHPEIARDGELAARFEQEAHAVNCLDHPGAVEILDIEVADDGAPFLVMELLEGQSLRERLAQCRLELPEVFDLIDQLLDVLVAAHTAEIIHRDIKPDNLFLLEHGQLKVLDFGIARVRRAGSMKVVTQLGTSLGTPSYMAQEQIKGVDVDHRVDLFAVGAVMFELLTGRRVHGGDNEQMVMVKMLTCPAPPLAGVAPETPAGLCQVVDRALAFEATERYPDALTMQSDLRAVRDGSPPPFAAGGADETHDRVTVLDGASDTASEPATVRQGAYGAASGAAVPAPTGIPATVPVSRPPSEPVARPRPWQSPGWVAACAALGLAVGIAIALWASCSADSDDEAPSSGAPNPDRVEASPSDGSVATSQPPDAGPTSPAPRQKSSKDQEREQKQREKELKRERKERDKQIKRGRQKLDKKRPR